MDTPVGILWPRARLAGFLAEVSVIAIVLPITLLFGKNTLTYSAPAASLLACFVFASWVGRRLTSRFVLHGMLVARAAGGLVVARRQKPTNQFQMPDGETRHS